MAAANRNKTKSQMRDSTQGHIQNAYGSEDPAKFINDGMRQSAQTALGTHGLSNTTKIVGLRSQGKAQDNQMNTRSSSVARLHGSSAAQNSQNVMASTQPRQISNSNKRGLPYVASQSGNAMAVSSTGGQSKQRNMNS